MPIHLSAMLRWTSVRCADKEQHSESPKAIKRKNTKTLNVSCREEKVLNRFYGCNPHTLQAYTAGGCKIHLTIAIDFTASNGDPIDSDSLHYISPSGQNEYMSSITSVVNILDSYTIEKKFMVVGFGAKSKSEGHSASSKPYFPLADDEVEGIDGVLEVYRKSLGQWMLAGPTAISQVIFATSQRAEDSCSQEDQNYFILLILMDGINSDMRETIYEIVRASCMPLSIVIMGIGNQDFSEMDVFNSSGKHQPLSYNGVEVDRDIVQFLCFRDFKDKLQLLSNEILSKIPWQLTSYMAIHGISPNSVEIMCNDRSTDERIGDEAKLDQQLKKLLKELGYSDLYDCFLKEKITYRALKKFGKDDLKELGLPLGPQVAIYNALHNKN